MLEYRFFNKLWAVRSNEVNFRTEAGQQNSNSLDGFANRNLILLYTIVHPGERRIRSEFIWRQQVINRKSGDAVADKSVIR